MNKQNLFWSVYKNLEKEFQKLADFIHFADDQINVYSMHIGNLLVRCSIEIEAISKELYSDIGGNMSPIEADGKQRDLYFDTDCLGLLDEKWKLSKKQVLVSATNFYFLNEENRILTPLYKANNRGTSGSKWKQAYQAFKHNRKNSFKKANVGNLLNAMGALYILNIYYKDETIDIGRVYMGTGEFDNRVGSEIFSVFNYRATVLKMASSMCDSCIVQNPDSNLDRAIYIIKYDNKSFSEMHRNYYINEQITINNFRNSPIIIKFLQENPEYETKSINEICMTAGGENLLNKIISYGHGRQEIDIRSEALLNKHTSIYPDLLPIEDYNFMK